MEMPYLFGICSLFFLFNSFSGCEGDEPGNCAFGCPTVYVLGQFNYINDTMYVGDTIILTLQIPDSVEETDQQGIVKNVKVKAFENLWSYISIFRIDTTQEDRLAGDSASVGMTILQGGSYKKSTFSETYPHIHQVQYVLRQAGIFFLRSGLDNTCRINEDLRVINIEFDVAEKHFEWLAPYIVPLGGSVERIKIRDDLDEVNYAPFQVLEK